MAFLIWCIIPLLWLLSSRLGVSVPMRPLNRSLLIPVRTGEAILTWQCQFAHPDIGLIIAIWETPSSSSRDVCSCTLAANYAFRYHPVKHLGIPGSNIILMLADDAACNPRNQPLYQSGSVVGSVQRGHRNRL
ncbi:hypothetical protein BS47DRAFT_503121 [Hydnum rufescens UP504]|uniref:Uncharacterized protein n=1 Tax=Hydnum rufescens UP504 TaxID=1448309 RepID=A0A9P6E087_9AGAM|nr:hypothetical protein BS47DRAFT_503121 [Hydnum rufescens UP504]